MKTKFYRHYQWGKSEKIDQLYIALKVKNLKQDYENPKV